MSPIGTGILDSMTYYTNPIPDGHDPSEYGDSELIEFMRKLRDDRKAKGTAISRFVRQISKAGYVITPAEYKEYETLPGKAIPAIREYLLTYAYRVLNSLRVQNSPQPKHTAHAMTVIGNARQSQGIEYYQMAEKLESRGVPMTEAEYRTLEQGIAKHVNFEVIAESAQILGIGVGELFR